MTDSSSYHHCFLCLTFLLNTIPLGDSNLAASYLAEGQLSWKTSFLIKVAIHPHIWFEFRVAFPPSYASASTTMTVACTQTWHPKGYYSWPWNSFYSKGKKSTKQLLFLSHVHYLNPAGLREHCNKLWKTASLQLRENTLPGWVQLWRMLCMFCFF